MKPPIAVRKLSAVEITGNVVTAVLLDDPVEIDCTQSIDLDGRTVIPGVSMGNRKSISSPA